MFSLWDPLGSLGLKTIEGNFVDVPYKQKSPFLSHGFGRMYLLIEAETSKLETFRSVKFPRR